MRSPATNPADGITIEVAPLFELAGTSGLANLLENVRELADFLVDVRELVETRFPEFGLNGWTPADAGYFAGFADLIALVIGKLVASQRRDGQPVLGTEVDPEADGVLRALLVQTKWPLGAVVEGLEAAAEKLRFRNEEAGGAPDFDGGYLHQLLRDLAFALRTLHEPVQPPEPPRPRCPRPAPKPDSPAAGGRVVPMVPRPDAQPATPAARAMRVVPGSIFVPHFRAAA